MSRTEFIARCLSMALLALCFCVAMALTSCHSCRISPWGEASADGKGVVKVSPGAQINCKF